MSLADVNEADITTLFDVASHAIRCGRALMPERWGLDRPHGSLIELVVDGERKARGEVYGVL